MQRPLPSYTDFHANIRLDSAGITLMDVKSCHVGNIFIILYLFSVDCLTITRYTAHTTVLHLSYTKIHASLHNRPVFPSRARYRPHCARCVIILTEKKSTGIPRIGNCPPISYVYACIRPGIRILSHILFCDLRTAHYDVDTLRRRGHTHALKVVVNGGGILAVGCNTFKTG